MIAIKVVNLAKSYKIYNKPSDSLKEFIFRRTYHEKINAIEGINFELLQGETLGIIGNNGAGKSTLLKMLAGTIAQSWGTRECHGRLSAILELGSGFHPDFSGIDNAKMGCALLGLSTKETELALPEILAFSELGEFFYKPVKTYSSGMYVRLAFSVVTTVDPDILIVDEALSVGDQHFQKKSLDRMQGFRNSGKTIIFCSHNLYQIKELCSKAIWLEEGKMMEYGDADTVVDNYQDSIRAQNNELEEKERSAASISNSDNQITGVNIGNNTEESVYITGKALQVVVEVELNTISVNEAHIGIVIMRNDNIHCYGVSTLIDKVDLQHLKGNIYCVNIKFEPLLLLSGNYYLCVYLLDKEGIHVYDHREQCANFVVRSNSKEVGIARLAHEWNT